MKNQIVFRLQRAGVLLAFALALSAPPAYGQPVRLTMSQLDQLVSRIALYPDPLLAQILAASTYWDQVPEAAQWARQHSYLTGEALAEAIRQDNLAWDPSVIALLPFPSVLEMTARDPAWVQQLGSAALSQREEVMDAVQRMRKKALDFGYLQSSRYASVSVNKGMSRYCLLFRVSFMFPLRTRWWSSQDPREVWWSAEQFVSVPVLPSERHLLLGDGRIPHFSGRATPS